MRAIVDALACSVLGLYPVLTEEQLVTWATEAMQWCREASSTGVTFEHMMNVLVTLSPVTGQPLDEPTEMGVFFSGGGSDVVYVTIAKTLAPTYGAIGACTVAPVKRGEEVAVAVVAESALVRKAWLSRDNGQTFESADPDSFRNLFGVFDLAN